MTTTTQRESGQVTVKGKLYQYWIGGGFAPAIRSVDNPEHPKYLTNGSVRFNEVIAAIAKAAGSH